MSTIFLQVGQCGNQLGHSFWQEVVEWYGIPYSGTLPRSVVRSNVQSGKPNKPRNKSSSSVSNQFNLPYSLLDNTLPCILVDTETKVVRKYTGEKTLLGKKIPSEFRVIERGGRGNNWAYGYFNAVGKELKIEKQIRGFKFGSTDEGKCLRGNVQECVRRLVEKCDRFGGFVQLHSIAGGTGSGVGSAITEQLRDDYPLSYILSVAVAPFSYGETPMQHYNSLFCLHQLQSHADGILFFQNDHILTQTMKSPDTTSQHLSATNRDTTSGGLGGGGGGGGGCGSVEDMNKHMSNTLCNILLPLWSANHKAPAMSGGEPWELIRSVCPDPGMKFILPSHCQLTRPTHSWDYALSTTASAYRATSTSTNADSASLPSTKPHTSALVSIFRGSPSSMTSLVSNTTIIEKKLKQTYNTVYWNPFPVDFWFSYEPQLRDKKMVCVLANSDTVADYLKSLVARARLMHREKAYLHWFEMYGCEQGMFEEAFESLDSIVANYSRLST